ncbi:MAG: GDYXXLXY domain-containing protein [Erythrobacter sp.]|uniref:GDYXXLXY domain-containing protein n=1 Tax=Erythrobacter sp. TaxID=1042 RepID=UPI0032EC8D7F
MTLSRLAAMLLPLAGLAGLWAWSDRVSRQGTEWEVPVAGYDPRDLLRGHYVEFTYDWPIREEAQAVDGPPLFRPPRQALCLSGNPPEIAQAVPFDPGDQAAFEACAHPLIADLSGIYGPAGLRTGRLYLDQYKAAMIQAQLRDGDQRGIVTIRQREDGSFTPIAIRFRPLSEAERAERETVRPAAPPIMVEPEPATNE